MPCNTRVVTVPVVRGRKRRRCWEIQSNDGKNSNTTRTGTVLRALLLMVDLLIILDSRLVWSTASLSSLTTSTNNLRRRNQIRRYINVNNIMIASSKEEIAENLLLTAATIRLLKQVNNNDSRSPNDDVKKETFVEIDDTIDDNETNDTNNMNDQDKNNHDDDVSSKKDNEKKDHKTKDESKSGQESEEDTKKSKSDAKDDEGSKEQQKHGNVEEEGTKNKNEELVAANKTKSNMDDKESTVLLDEDSNELEMTIMKNIPTTMPTRIATLAPETTSIPTVGIRTLEPTYIPTIATSNPEPTSIPTIATTATEPTSIPTVTTPDPSYEPSHEPTAETTLSPSSSVQQSSEEEFISGSTPLTPTTTEFSSSFLSASPSCSNASSTARTARPSYNYFSEAASPDSGALEYLTAPHRSPLTSPINQSDPQPVTSSASAPVPKPSAALDYLTKPTLSSPPYTSYSTIAYPVPTQSPTPTGNNIFAAAQRTRATPAPAVRTFSPLLRANPIPSSYNTVAISRPANTVVDFPPAPYTSPPWLSHPAPTPTFTHPPWLNRPAPTSIPYASNIGNDNNNNIQQPQPYYNDDNYQQQPYNGNNYQQQQPYYGNNYQQQQPYNGSSYQQQQQQQYYYFQPPPPLYYYPPLLFGMGMQTQPQQPQAPPTTQMPVSAPSGSPSALPTVDFNNYFGGAGSSSWWVPPPTLWQPISSPVAQPLVYISPAMIPQPVPGDAVMAGVLVKPDAGSLPPVAALLPPPNVGDVRIALFTLELETFSGDGNINANGVTDILEEYLVKAMLYNNLQEIQLTVIDYKSNIADGGSVLRKLDFSGTASFDLSNGYLPPTDAFRDELGFTLLDISGLQRYFDEHYLNYGGRFLVLNATVYEGEITHAGSNKDTAETGASLSNVDRTEDDARTIIFTGVLSASLIFLSAILIVRRQRQIAAVTQADGHKVIPNTHLPIEISFDQKDIVSHSVSPSGLSFASLDYYDKTFGGMPNTIKQRTPDSTWSKYDRSTRTHKYDVLALKPTTHESSDDSVFSEASDLDLLTALSDIGAESGSVHNQVDPLLCEDCEQEHDDDSDFNDCEV